MPNADHWSKFVWADWRSDPNLNRCSHAAKGVWIDALALAFECELSGVFSTAGKPWPITDIARALPGDAAETQKCLDELIDKGVLKRDEDGAYYSKRMRDEADLRDKRSQCGKLGGKQSIKQKPSKPPSKIKANGQAKLKQTLSDSNSNSDSSGRGGTGGDGAPESGLAWDELCRVGVRLPRSLAANAEFQEHWRSWLDARGEENDVLTPARANMILSELAGIPADSAIESVKAAIAGNYKRPIVRQRVNGTSAEAAAERTKASLKGV